MSILEVIPVDIVDRIFELVDEKFKEQKDFASALGVPAPRVSEWRKRKSASYQRCLTQISDVLNTTTEYLLTGEGPKKRGIPRNAVIKISGRHQISESARDVAFAYDDASPELQAAVRRVLGLD